MFPMPLFLILLAVSLALCAVGFKRFVWFMSVGYGVSTAGIGAALLIASLVKGETSLVYIIQCLLFLVYGVRLGGFLLVRELKNKSYRAKLDEIGANSAPPVFVMVCMWLVCGALYVCQCSPAAYRLSNSLASAPNAFAVLGVVVSAAGIVLEAVADKQKSAQKAKNPAMPAMEGLFKISRCPNYFGEMVFWTGVLLSGIGAVQGWQWLIAAVGYVAIIYIMISGAKRLETRHNKNYGAKPEYKAYADSTPILVPFIPVYHLVKEEKK